MFNIKKILCAIIITLYVCQTFGQEGSHTYSFLNISPSAKIYGLGGINISSVDAGIESVEQNPALLGPEYSKSLGLSYMNYFGGSNFGAITYGNSINDNSAWGVGIRYLGYGSIQKTDIEGTVIGDFSPLDFIASVMYSRNINNYLRGGINVKSIYSAYDEYNAFALAIDLGINYYNADKDLSLSATIMNLGGQLKRFNETYERLPIDIRLGWTQSFPELPIRFSVTAWDLTKWRNNYAEENFELNNSNGNNRNFFNTLFRHLIFAADLIPSENFYFSIGYNYRIRTDMSSYYRNLLSGIYLGCGLKISQWGIGIAFAQPHRGQNTFMINISTSLNQFL